MINVSSRPFGMIDDLFCFYDNHEKDNHDLISILRTECEYEYDTDLFLSFKLLIFL
jgi:hypothetical protein